jgi:mono/diheme cytochrome c family protein
VARGEYLVEHLANCADCHGASGAGGFGGGRDFAIPTGMGATRHVFAPNLTGDRETGLGNWSVDDVKRALTTGIDADGKPLSPIMPYAMYANLTDDDATSIALYVKSLAPIKNAVPKRTLDVPAVALPLEVARIPQTTVGPWSWGFGLAQAGRYLASVSCIECHTPSAAAPAQGLDWSKVFAGGRAFGPILSANLTPDRTGLADWTPDDIVSTLETDHERGSGRALCGPMPGGCDRLGGLTQWDKQAIAAYLFTVPAVENGPFGCREGASGSSCACPATP